MTPATRVQTRAWRVTASKVPEVTIWFWLIKILCTTVGESFADWINMGLGVGLELTAVIFTVVLGAVLAVQLRLSRYVPTVYWLTVVVVSVAGTLYTDILTDTLAVPLSVSTTVFTVALVVVFGVWYARERTLSIHSITTRPREVFYWLAVLVTFALGTAAGDWTLALTGWPPGISVLLPLTLIAAVAIGWRVGVNSVLSFWLAYILTRPLGANLGDFLAAPQTDHGLGLSYGLTSVIFLVAIAAAVTYLTLTRVDVIEARQETPQQSTSPRPVRRVSVVSTVGYYAVVVLAAGALLQWASMQPHSTKGGSEDEAGPVAAAAPLTPGKVSAFPAADIANFRTITQDTLVKVTAGDQSGARTRITDLETAWDHAQDRLQAIDPDTWSVLDHQIDAVLKSIRSANPSADDEKRTLTTLLDSLR
ncbi:COG4705 family protein [Mycolicibacterium sp. HS_4_1]